MYVGSRHQLLFAVFGYLLAMTLSYATFHDNAQHLQHVGWMLEIASFVLFSIFTYNLLVCCFKNPGAIGKSSVTSAEVRKASKIRKAFANNRDSVETNIELDDSNDENLETSREVYRPNARRSTLRVV